MREVDDHTVRYLLEGEMLAHVQEMGSSLAKGAYRGDAGLDLTTREDAIFHEGETLNIPCGVAIALPPGTFGWICARSSTWVRHGVMIIPGIIDEGWRGELFTVGYRPPQPRGAHSWEVKIPAGTRLAQLIILPNLMNRVAIYPVTQLPEGSRGERGFGSTG